MPKYNFSEHKDEILTDLIKKLLWVPFAAIIPIVNYLIVKPIMNNSNNNYLILSIIALIIAVLSFITAICMTFKLRTKNNKTEIQDSNTVLPINDFRINSVDCELCFKNRKEIICTLSYDMIANNDGIDSFEKEIIWTGSDYLGTKLTEQNRDCTLELFDSNNSIHKYKIKFNEPVQLQDVVKFKLVTEVCDNDLSMMPFNSYMVKHQIDKLTVRVVVPRNIIRHVKGSIYSDLLRQLQIGSSVTINKKMIGGKECYEKTFDTPTISHRYFLEWEFTKNE